MTLLQLNYFCAVARYLNFNEAARNLFVSQPTLSKSIAALEAELGFLLFERKGRHIELTKYGQQYYEQIAPALSTISQATRSIQEMTGVNSGHIDIAYNPPFAQGFVPDTVSQFLSQQKGRQITVQFNQASSTVIKEGLLSGKYDIGFATMPDDDPRLIFVPLMTEPMVIITPPNHPLALRSRLRLADLSDWPFLNYTKECGLRPIVDRFFRENMPHSPQILFYAPDERSIASLVAGGMGIALVAAVPALNEFQIRQIPISEPVCERIIYMVYDANRYLTPVVQHFITFVRRTATAMDH